MQLLISDFDGTFYTGEEQVKRNVDSVLKWQEKGNLFMLSSGRSYESLMNKISTYHIPFDYISTGDGSYLFDKDSLLFETILSKDIYPDIEELEALGLHKELQFGAPYSYLPNLPEEPISSINFSIRRQDITPEFRKEWKKIKRNKNYSFLEYGYQEMVFFCIKPLGVTKSTPIHFLESSISLPKSDIYTVGDGDNDRFMIEDYNGYRIGSNKTLKKVSLGTYQDVHELISDIEKQKVLKRY